VTEFKWHLMAEEAPEEGKGRYIIMGQRGAMYYADSFEVDTHIDLGGYFHVPNIRCGYKNVREIKAWAEIPMLEVES
jgi:hypothetical protein